MKDTDYEVQGEAHIAHKHMILLVAAETKQLSELPPEERLKEIQRLARLRREQKCGGCEKCQ